MLQKLGVQVLYTSGHHRKLAIIDREILYEGSLNIPSQNDELRNYAAHLLGGDRKPDVGAYETWEILGVITTCGISLICVQRV
jgi:hypothetical protein